MRILITAIVLAVIAAVCDYFFGIKDPWRKIIFAGIVIIFIVGLVVLLVPGLIPIGGLQSDSPFQFAAIGR